MKPGNIEQRKAKRKREAVVSVVMYALLELVTGVVFGILTLIPDLPGWLAILFGGFGGLCILSIIPAIALLKDRFKEIEGGELDAAGKY